MNASKTAVDWRGNRWTMAPEGDGFRVAREGRPGRWFASFGLARRSFEFTTQSPSPEFLAHVRSLVVVPGAMGATEDTL